MNPRILKIVLMSLLAALITAGAVFSIPMPPPLPPVTLAVFFALVAGLILGPWWGLGSTALYLLLGSLGLPVFANGGGGFGYFAGPTGGFLLGYAAAALTAGLISSQRTWSFIRALSGCLAAVIALYAIGLPWFSFSLAARSGNPASLAGAFLIMAPYLVGDVIKAILAAFLLRSLKPLLQNYFAESR
ncbi:MAG: biotin transporter BioY [Spirochaetes bacterium]|nr:biotin transporter BioY [Spirochaetota bacterium]MBU0957071.1 biotin transporter BioY [Spirochaetota bacterium]